MNVPDGGLPSSWPRVWGCIIHPLALCIVVLDQGTTEDLLQGGVQLCWASRLSVTCSESLQRLVRQTVYLYSPFFPPLDSTHSSQVSDWNRAWNHLMVICFGFVCLEQSDHGMCCPVKNGLERSELRAVQAERCQKERHCHLSCKWCLVWWGWKNSGPKSRKPGLELACDQMWAVNSSGPQFILLQTGSVLTSSDLLWFQVDISWALLNIPHDLTNIWAMRNHR